MEHTPTPWTYIEDPRGRLVHVETDINNPHGAGLPVCSIPVKRKDDAEFIYLACNAYEANQQTIKALREALVELLEYGDSAYPDIRADAKIKARAALKLAGE